MFYALALEKLFPGRAVDGGRLYYCTTTGEFKDVSVALDDGTRAEARFVVKMVGEWLAKSTLPAAPRARGAGDALDWIVRSCMRRACVANLGNANAATSAAFGGGLDRVAAQRLLSGQWTSNWPFSVKALATPEV